MADASSPRDALIPVRGIRLHARIWDEAGPPIIFVHGLASNCLTWEAVARRLAAYHHFVAAIDQRGHGLSDKPDAGYGFDEVTADLRELIRGLGLNAPPVLAGQSWGASVVLDFAARYPDALAGVVLVDGGVNELSARPGATWERISVDLRPPNLLGRPRAEMAERMRRSHPDWSDEGIEHTLANFETLPDGTVRPWLSLDHHLAILRSLWEHHPPQIFGRVAAPVLIAPAVRGDAQAQEGKRRSVARAEASLRRCRVHWFEGADHDVHVQRPDELADAILGAFADGFFAPGPMGPDE